MRDFYEFITLNNGLIGFVIVSGSAVFSFIKWIDSRNRELREKKFEKYMKLISIISGASDGSNSPKLTQQIAATWFLLEYRE